ncbi:MAG: hypothetical protein K2X27_19690, partial [Candidatus Obscuribacterales bacterium]|nr:hypothetical protein [Candidatus Obscuribacterales bacterium]
MPGKPNSLAKLCLLLFWASLLQVQWAKALPTSNEEARIKLLIENYRKYLQSDCDKELCRKYWAELPNFLSAGELPKLHYVLTNELLKNPKDEAARTLLAERLLMHQEFSHAQKQLDILKEQGAGEYFRLAALNDIEHGHTNESTEAIKRYLQKRKSAEGYYLLALIMAGNRDSQRSKQALQRIEELCPELPGKNRIKSREAENNKDFERSLKLLNYYLNVIADDIPALTNRIVLLLKMGKEAEACSTLARQSNQNINSYEINYAIGYLYTDIKIRRAIEFYGRCIKLNPNDPRAF